VIDWLRLFVLSPVALVCVTFAHWFGSKAGNVKHGVTPLGVCDAFCACVVPLCASWF